MIGGMGAIAPAPGIAADAGIVHLAGERGRLRRVRDRAIGVEPTWQPEPGACGNGVPGAASHGGNERRADGDPGRIACGERSQPDAAICIVVVKRSAGWQAVEASRKPIDYCTSSRINLELGL